MRLTIWLTPCCLLNGLSAQPDKNGKKPQPQKVVEWQLPIGSPTLPKLQFPRKLHFQPKLRIGPKNPRVILGPRFKPFSKLSILPPNSLMRGDYKLALDAFDHHCGQLDQTSDLKGANPLIDILEHDLVAIRRTLFEAMKARKKGKTLPVIVYSPVYGPKWHLQFQRPAPSGPLREVLGDLKGIRRTLDAISDPKAARKVIDRMERKIGDLRRTLWKHREAKKAERKD